MRLFKIMETAYQNFDNTVDTYIKKMFSSLGISNSNSQIFSIIYKGIQGIIQNAMFYIEDALTEQNIFTATRKKSIFNLAKISGYEPFFGSAATGTVIIKTKRGTILENNLTKIFIKNNTRIINTITNTRYIILMSGNEFVIDMNKPLINHEFKIVEGDFNYNRFFANGDDFESVNIETSKLYDRSYVSVYVNGVKYEICDNIYDMSENENQCVLTAGYDNSFSIIFGNNAHGKKLLAGDNVVVEWLSHLGKKGNIMTSENSKFAFYDSGYDKLGNMVNLNTFLTVTKNNCISGGIDADNIDIIRNMIGYNSRSLVLASRDNFILYFKRFSFIGRVNCWFGPNSLNIFITCITNAINEVTTPESYFVIPKESLYLNTDQENQIISALGNSNKLYAGTTITFVKPLIRRYAAICFIKEDDIYNRNLIQEHIRNSMANYFINLPNNVSIIYKSEIVNKIINECENIKFLDITFVSELAEETYKNTYYEKYELTNVDNHYVYTSKKVFYETDNQPGLDKYGNITLGTVLEMPLLQGGFHYYPNKETNDRNTSINIETIQYYYI